MMDEAKLKGFEEMLKGNVHWLLVGAAHLPPQVFKARFCGLIGNVVANLPEEYWREFSKVEPCGRTGCDCHLELQPAFQKTFDMVRRYHAYKGLGGIEVTE